ncbi:MAG: helix-turn-helix transcriptional regulator [Afipia sp.]
MSGPLQLLTDLEVANLLRISRPSLWRWCREGKFPTPIKIGENSSRWRATDVDAWLARQVAESEAHHDGAGAA